VRACVRACVRVRVRVCVCVRVLVPCQWGTFRLEVTGKFKVGAVAPGGPVPPVTPGGGLCNWLSPSRGLKCPWPAPAVLGNRAGGYGLRRVRVVTVPTVGPLSEVEGRGLAPASREAAVTSHPGRSGSPSERASRHVRVATVPTVGPA
jgi:hypothetical protein